MSPLALAFALLAATASGAAAADGGSGQSGVFPAVLQPLGIRPGDSKPAPRSEAGQETFLIEAGCVLRVGDVLKTQAELYGVFKAQGGRASATGGGLSQSQETGLDFVFPPASLQEQDGRASALLAELKRLGAVEAPRKDLRPSLEKRREAAVRSLQELRQETAALAEPLAKSPRLSALVAAETLRLEAFDPWRDERASMTFHVILRRAPAQ